MGTKRKPVPFRQADGASTAPGRGQMNQMKHRTISALIAVAVVGVAMAVPARSSRAEPAADDCLEQPSGAAPQGSHWYYRTDRSTNRRCWRLAPQREKAKEAREVAPSKPQPASRPMPEPKAEPPAESRRPHRHAAALCPDAVTGPSGTGRSNRTGAGTCRCDRAGAGAVDRSGCRSAAGGAAPARGGRAERPAVDGGGRERG